MSFKVIFLCFLGISSAIIINPDEKYAISNWHGRKQTKHWRLIPVYQHPNSFGHMSKYQEPHTYPKYEFKYMISDKKTGDHKQHQESRDGDRVQGEYSLVEPNGFIRKVQYHADDHHGFNAIVSKSYIKHGDDAYSAFMHTTYVTPSSGYHIKINHPLPPKYYYKKTKQYEGQDNISKLDTEIKEEQGSKLDDKTSIEFEAQKVILLKEPVTTVADPKSSKLENDGKQEANAEVKEMSSAAHATKESNLPVNMLPAIAMVMSEPRDETNSQTSKQMNNDSKTQVMDAQPDSAISSSHYRSRIYYLI